MGRLVLSILKISGRRSSLGQSTVEFALVIPVFLLITIGIVDLGRGIIANNVISNAAREGARAGIYPGTTDTAISTAINQETAFLGNVPVATADPGTGNWVSVSPSEASGLRKSGNTITVVVHYRFLPVTPVLSNLVGSSINLSASSTMLIE